MKSTISVFDETDEIDRFIALERQIDAAFLRESIAVMLFTSIGVILGALTCMAIIGRAHEAVANCLLMASL